MAENNIALMAHLMRRAAFGAPYEELEVRAAKGYEATVEELLHPENQPDGIDMDVLERYFAEWQGMIAGGPALWTWRMINSKRPLEERSPSSGMAFYAPAPPRSSTPDNSKSS